MPYAHFTRQERIELQEFLTRGISCKEIGYRLDKDPTSVSREIKRNRMQDTGGRFNCKKPSLLCAYFKTCNVEELCERCIGKRCATCTKINCTRLCASFKKKVCRKITRFPYVCNGCSSKRSCKLEKYVYSAQVAHAKALRNVSEPRCGIDLTGRQAAHLDALISPLMMKNQSLNQIYMKHKCEIPCSLKSLYTYVNKGEIGPGRMRLIEAVSRKPRKKKRMSNSARTPRASLAGRSWQDYLALDEEERDGRWEMDTVIGKKGGKCLLTLLHRPTRFQLALLLNRCSSAEVIRALRVIACVFERTVQEVFYLVITDNGSEFFDAKGIEDTLGCRLFYCESYASWQKGAAERNHRFYRRVVPKGTSFEDLDGHDCALMMSHVNSTPRPVLAGISPLEAVLPFVGQDFLDAFGIESIARDDVMLKPELLSKAN